MVIDLKQSRIRFNFDERHDRWGYIVELDQNKDIQKIKTAVSGTKDVDILAIYQDQPKSNNELLLLEATNYKQSSQSIPKIDDFAIEFAQKVRDSLAAALGGARNSTHDKAKWQDVIQLVMGARLHLIVWVEEDIQGMNQKAQNARKATILDKLQQKLKWLSPRILLLNKQAYDENPCFHDLTVTLY